MSKSRNIALSDRMSISALEILDNFTGRETLGHT